jgi:hypothetical protein
MSEPQHLDISGFDDESFSVPIAEFDWESIFAADEADEARAEHAIEIAKKLTGITELKELFAYAYRRGREDERSGWIKRLQWADRWGSVSLEGWAVRSAIINWRWNPEYKNTSQAGLRKRYGFSKKQLVNREVSDYRDTFKNEHDPRLYSEEAREAYAVRFQTSPDVGDSAVDREA